MFQSIDYQVIAIIAVAIFLLNIIISYQVIMGATKAKKLLKCSNAQLKVLIELALASGVPKEKIKYEIKICEKSALEQAINDRYNNLITPDELEKIKSEIK